MKKRFLGIGLVALAVLLTVGLASCSSPSSSEPTPYTPQSGAELDWIKIGVIPTLGAWANDSGLTVEAVLDGNYDAVEIPLTLAQADKAITYQTPASSTKATVKFAQIPGVDDVENPIDLGDVDPEDVEAALSATATGRTFADLDYLVVKVTSEDGSKTNYYRYNITLGRNANLKSITIGSTPQEDEKWLGKPNADITAVEIGDFQTDVIIPSSRFIPLAEDTAATVTYAFVEGEPASEPGTLTAIDTEEGVSWTSLVQGGLNVTPDTHLVIKVESTSTTNKATLFYVVRLVFPQAGAIQYGVPKLVDPSNAGNPFYIDPIWNSVDWDFDISRANQSETVEGYFRPATEAGTHTQAKAKALWDDGGIWVLVDVDVSPFNNGSGVVDRPITPANEHNGDSLEVFINERLQIQQPAGGTDPNKVNDIGNQFRVGVSNDRSGRASNAQSSDPASSLAPFNSGTYAKTRTALYNTSSQYVGSLEEAKNGGYMVIAYVPFKFKDSTNASDVFDAQGKVIPDTSIGFELQINTNVGGARDGILTWNGFNTIAYENSSGYGIVTLERGTNPDGSSVVFPEITAQSLSEKEYLFEATANPLSVTTTGTIQWYSSATQFGAGTPLAGQTSATFTPPTGVAGTTYYYAVVTAGGVSVVTDRRAKIKVYAEGEEPIDDLPIPAYERVTLNDNAYAIYKFVLPAGAKWSEYEKITVEYRASAATLATQIRSSRVYGNYEASSFGAVDSTTGFRAVSFDNGYIFDDHGQSWNTNWAALSDTGTVEADEWFSVTYQIDGSRISDAAYFLHEPGPNDNGPFYFGLGVPGAGGSATTLDIRNATLVSTGGTKDVVSTGSGFAEPTFVAYNNGAGCARAVNSD